MGGPGLCRWHAELCHLAIGHARRGTFTGGNDEDWFSVGLQAGHAYTASYASPEGELTGIVSFVDRRGKTLASVEVPSTGGSLTFVPRTTGTYFLAVGNGDGDFGGSYEVALQGR